MKKLAFMLFVAVMSIAFVACGDSKDSQTQSSVDLSESTQKSTQDSRLIFLQKKEVKNIKNFLIALIVVALVIMAIVAVMLLEFVGYMILAMLIATLLAKRKMVIFVLWCVICFAPFCLAIYTDIMDRNRFTDESAIWVCGYIVTTSLIWTLPILLFCLILSWGKAYFKKH